MHKANNIVIIFFSFKKKTRWPNAGGGLKQGTFPYSYLHIRTDITFTYFSVIYSHPIRIQDIYLKFLNYMTYYMCSFWLKTRPSTDVRILS